MSSRSQSSRLISILGGLPFLDLLSSNSRCKISAIKRLLAISPPWAPAFPSTAPPTVPGIPAAHSSPPNPREPAWRAS